MTAATRPGDLQAVREDARAIRGLARKLVERGITNPALQSCIDSFEYCRLASPRMIGWICDLALAASPADPSSPIPQSKSQAKRFAALADAEPASAAEGAKPIIPNWFPDDRCQVCGWPLAPSRDQGCVAGDCSFRPQEGTDSYRITQLRRKALAERADPAQSADTPSEAVPPIEANKFYKDRFYIPLPGGWEIQTKGGGSSFRICDTKSGQRLPITPQPYLYETLERMGREIHAAWVALASRPQPARGEVSEAEVDAALQAERDFDDRPFPARRITKNRIRAALEAAARVRGNSPKSLDGSGAQKLEKNA